MDVGKFDEGSELKKIKIDAKDRKIISLLSINSRMPLTKIASKVKLSRDSINYRIDRLIRHEVILKFYPIISLRRFGFSMFHLYVLMDETKSEQKTQLINHLKKSPNVISLIEYSDRWDFEIVVAAKNLKQFDALITELVSIYPDLIVEKDKYQVIKSYYFNPIPHELLQYKDAYYEKYDDTMVEVDQTDLKILEILSENCRLSTYDISSKINISPDAVGYRIKNLLKKDVIKKFTIIANLTQLDYHWYTFAMQVKVLDKQQEAKLISFIQYNPLIIRALKVLGTWDLIFYIVARNPKDFHSTIKDIKNKFANITINYQTWVGYKEHFFNPLPKVVCKNEKPFK